MNKPIIARLDKMIETIEFANWVDGRCIVWCMFWRGRGEFRCSLERNKTRTHRRSTEWDKCGFSPRE